MRRAARARDAGRPADVEPVQSPASILPGTLLQKTCAYCGKLFTTPNPKRLHCSPECTRAHDNARRRDRRATNEEGQTFSPGWWSIKEYHPWAESQDAEDDVAGNALTDDWTETPMDEEDEQYKSIMEHQQDPDTYLGPNEHVCPNCGIHFVSKNKRKIFCSIQCRNKDESKRRRNKNNTPQEIIPVQQEQVVSTNNTVTRSVHMDEDDDKMKRIEIAAEYFRSAYLRLQEAYKAREDAKLFFEQAVKSGEKAGIYTWDASEGIR